MSNIEPTEEQRAAVRAIAEKEGARVQLWHLDEIARLLAEREAKLRERQETMKGLIAALDEDRATLRARVAELEAEVAFKDEERTMQVSMIQSLRNAREAQHLADIKALRRQLDLSDDVVREYASGYTELLRENTSVLARLAHYDDAKADAPAVDMQAWANGTCPEPGCSLANPHEQGVACVKPTAEGGEG